MKPEEKQAKSLTSNLWELLRRGTEHVCGRGYVLAKKRL